MEMHAASAPPAPARPIRDWIVRHDDSRAFTVLYIALALVLSLSIGLFWLVALVTVHFTFEYVRFRHEQAERPRALAQAAWALKLDFALVLFALVVTLYLQFVLGVLGIQAASRAGAAAKAGTKGGARLAAWENVIRGALISVDDAARVVHAFFVLRKRRAPEPLPSTAAMTGPTTASIADAPAMLAASVAAIDDRGTGHPGPDQPVAPRAPKAGRAAARLGRGDVFAFALAAACLLLIAAAPWLGHDVDSVLATFAAELHPFPSR
jgi:hypothetical protein